MIYFLRMVHEFTGGGEGFVDFEDLDESLVDAILAIANSRKAQGDSDWFVEGKFPEGQVENLENWRSMLNPEFFFTYRRFGRKVPFDPDDVRKPRVGSSTYDEIAPTDAFDKLPLEILKEFTGAFREHLEDESYYFVGDDPVVVFTPMFEKELVKRS